MFYFCLSVSLGRRSDALTSFHTATPLSRGCCVKISVGYQSQFLFSSFPQFAIYFSANFYVRSLSQSKQSHRSVVHIFREMLIDIFLQNCNKFHVEDRTHNTLSESPQYFFVYNIDVGRLACSFIAQWLFYRRLLLSNFVIGSLYTPPPHDDIYPVVCPFICQSVSYELLWILWTEKQKSFRKIKI